MTDALKSRLRQSALLAAGILLTIVAMAAHRFLPERTLRLDPTKEGAVYFVMNFGADAATKVDWVDMSRLHFRCRFAKEAPDGTCSYTYLLYEGEAANKGVDLSRFNSLNLKVRYSGPARHLKVAIRNFDPRFSTLEDNNSTKFNQLDLQPKDLAEPLSVDLHEFTVPDWWVAQYDLPRQLARPDISNAIAFSLFLQGEAPDVDHDIQIESIEFSGDWISAEAWYFGILCIWLVIGVGHATMQWIDLRKKYREQRYKLFELQGEKDKYRTLATVDGLTKVLNRHGIEQFVESQHAANLPTSVIVVDLDHFKHINDHRGHYDGDRVLTTVGDLLRTHTRNTDGLGRWGGEEFVLVCPGATLAKAANLAEKLRERIEHTNFIPEDPIAVTASFGVATYDADGNFDDAFRQADQALYLAKNRGRNCVVAASGDQMHKVTGARKGTWALISGRFKLHGSGHAKEN